MATNDEYNMAMDVAADLVLRITSAQREGASAAIQDMVAKVNFILTTHDLWSEDGTYTFPDGDTWRAPERRAPVTKPSPFLDGTD